MVLVWALLYFSWHAIFVYLPITKRKLYNGQFCHKESRAHAGCRSSFSGSDRNKYPAPRVTRNSTFNDALLAKNEACRFPHWRSRSFSTSLGSHHFSCRSHKSDALGKNLAFTDLVPVVCLESQKMESVSHHPKNGVENAARAEPIKKRRTLQFNRRTRCTFQKMDR